MLYIAKTNLLFKPTLRKLECSIIRPYINNIIIKLGPSWIISDHTLDKGTTPHIDSVYAVQIIGNKWDNLS